MLDHIMDGHHHQDHSLGHLVYSGGGNSGTCSAPGSKPREGDERERRHPGSSSDGSKPATIVGAHAAALAATSSAGAAAPTVGGSHAPASSASTGVAASTPGPPESSVALAAHVAAAAAAPGAVAAAPPTGTSHTTPATAAVVAAKLVPLPEAAASTTDDTPDSGPPVATAASSVDEVVTAKLHSAGAAEISESSTLTAPAPSAGKALAAAVAAASDDAEANSELGVSPEARAHARSERKRTREKQRRSDVNAQFASLTALLRKIEQEDLAADTAELRGSGSRGSGAELEERKSTLGFLNTIGRTGCPTNRADLIAMTICVLERLHAQNGRIRKDRSELQRELEESKKKSEDLARKHKQAEAAAHQAALGAAHQAAIPKQEQVMMMVPMMVAPDQVAGIHNATHGMRMPFPFMSQPPSQMTPAAPFMPQMQQQPPPAPQLQPPTAAPDSSHVAGTSPKVTQTQTSATAATAAEAVHPPPHSSSAPPAPAAPRHPPMMSTSGFPMMMNPHPSGFFFNSAKLPAHPPLPNSMMPSIMSAANTTQQPFPMASTATPQAVCAVPPPQGHLMSQPPLPSHSIPGTTATSQSAEQSKSQEQESRPQTSPSLHGGGGPRHFPPPPPSDGSSGAGAGAGTGTNGGGGGNLAHCA